MESRLYVAASGERDDAASSLRVGEGYFTVSYGVPRSRYRSRLLIPTQTVELDRRETIGLKREFTNLEPASAHRLVAVGAASTGENLIVSSVEVDDGDRLWKRSWRSSWTKGLAAARTNVLGLFFVNGLQWVAAEAHTHIARQLETADALDAKAGVIFAYCGALLVAVPAVLRCGAEGFAVVAGAFAFGGLALAGVNLIPVTYKDPPDPFKLLDHVREAREQSREILGALIEEQWIALSSNTTLIDEKILRFKGAVVLAALASFGVAIEVLVGRGCPGA